MDFRPIGIFDSGIGGLSVLEACRNTLPREDYIYLADEANMPYGTHGGDEIRLYAAACAERLVCMGCKAIVAACNTATETAIELIRALYPHIPVIGLEPAVKPCLRDLADGEYAVALVTEATANSERFNRLIWGEKRIIALPQAGLARLVELNADDLSALYGYTAEILSPYMDASAIILGCSHYAFLSDIITEIYGGRVKIYDGAIGAAARLKDVLEKSGDVTDGRGVVRFFSTYKKAPV